MFSSEYRRQQHVIAAGDENGEQKQRQELFDRGEKCDAEIVRDDCRADVRGAQLTRGEADAHQQRQQKRAAVRDHGVGQRDKGRGRGARSRDQRAERVQDHEHQKRRNGQMLEIRRQHVDHAAKDQKVLEDIRHRNTEQRL